jgi:hypothetical protein
MAFQYLFFRQGPFDKLMGIKAATLEIEKSRADDIVVAYSDGGVIVITGGPVDFQQQGVAADWWQIETSRFPYPHVRHHGLTRRSVFMSGMFDCCIDHVPGLPFSFATSLRRR